MGGVRSDSDRRERPQLMALTASLGLLRAVRKSCIADKAATNADHQIGAHGDLCPGATLASRSITVSCLYSLTLNVQRTSVHELYA